MRKLISMMLMLCAIVTFSACSSDDDGPTNPISNAVVPSSAKIGSEVTVQGSGFATGQTILLQPETGAAVDVNAKVSSNGATFTVPYTMSTGKVNVVLKSGNDSWTLGSINLLDADNPISALSLPSEMALGQEVTISGIGFADGDKIFLGTQSTRSDMVENSYISATVTSDGLKFTVPNVDYEGMVDVKLVRGIHSWSLGDAYIYRARQIESITISGNAMMSMYAGMIGLTDDALKLNLSYNEDGSLKAISSNSGLEWAFAYDGKTVSTTGNTNGAPYTYTLDDNGRIVKSTGYDMYGDDVTYTWNYDADGHLVSVKQDGSKDDSDFSCTYKDGNMAGYNLALANELATDNNIHACPYTVEPIYLLNSFGLIFTREDLFIGFLINRDVKVSSFVPNQFIAGDIDNATGETITNTAAIEKSFANNKLTLTTTGSAISGAQNIYANTVVVTYKNK